MRGAVSIRSFVLAAVACLVAAIYCERLVAKPQHGGAQPIVAANGLPEPTSGTLAASLERAIEDCIVEMRAATASARTTGKLESVGGNAGDEEWLSLPRGFAGIIGLCRCASPDLVAAKMYRSIEMNPRDRYIPKAQRAELAAIMAAIQPKLVDFMSVRMQVYGTDLDAARARGLLRDLGVEAKVVRADKLHPAGEGALLESFSIKQVTDAGADMGVSVNGRLLGASRMDFPASRSAVEMERLVGAELVACLVTWFSFVGTLEKHEVDALLESSFR